MRESFCRLQSHLERASALGAALALFSWDSETLAPKKAAQYTSKAVGILSGEMFGALVNDTTRELMALCEKETDLSLEEKALLRVLKKQFEDLEKLPRKEYEAYQELIAKAPSIWNEAKEKQDFSLFAPALKQIVEYNRRFAALRAEKGQRPYDVLLNDYEEGFTIKVLDPFFAQLKQEIVPLLRYVEKNPQPEPPVRRCSVEKQREFNRFLAEYMGFDFDRGVLGETEHPFTDGLHSYDVRIATHYYEDNPESGIFSTIHEGGHAIYEQQINPEYNLTLLGGGGGCGLHESQSRFFENVIGRSKAFWKPIYSRLQNTFPEAFGELPLDGFIREVNRAQASLIRTEADELTYSLHILVRYELEKELMEGSVQVEDLPRAWNEKYAEYLGVTPQNDAEGVLQDIHWASGLFGYFPSYALGSAIASQLFACMKREMPLEKYLEEGNLLPIREFLREHVHQWGKAKTTGEILRETTGEDFDAFYYMEYLKEKFGR